MRTFSLASCVLLSLCLGSPAGAGVAPNGREFHVNTYTTHFQKYPAVGMDDDGDFVVVWESQTQDGSSSGIFGQMFDSAGGRVSAEFQVNTYTTGGQRMPAVGMDEDGDFVVAWSSDLQNGSVSLISAQMFDSTGSMAGWEFQVSPTTTSGQWDPAVAVDADGDFVVAWIGLDGSSVGIFARRFDSFGYPVGTEFQVNASTPETQSSPSVGMDDDGGFVVAWESRSSSNGASIGIFARRYDSSGAAVGTEFQVNAYTLGIQNRPAVGMSGDGHFVVAWRGEHPNGESGEVLTFVEGVPGNAMANTYTPLGQGYPAVAMDDDDDFVVAWTSQGQDGSSGGIFARRYSIHGTWMSAVGAEFQVNTTTARLQWAPSVAMDGDGDFVVAWISYLPVGGSNQEILAQRVRTADGPAIASPASMQVQDCSDPALSRPTFHWETGDYDRFKVFMGSSAGFEKGTRVTSGDRMLATDTWTPGRKKWKRACKKSLRQSADPGNPVMYIAVLGVDRHRLKSDPLRKLSSFPVCIRVQP